MPDDLEGWDTPRMRVLLARALLVSVVSAASTPAEWLVPVLRTAAGRRGVHLGPTTAALLAVALAVEQVEGPERPGRRARSAAASDALVLGPAAVLPVCAAAVPSLVVLPRRSPLWGWAVAAAGRFAVATVIAWDDERRKRREAAG
ncbi:MULTISPECIES: hypothetical protein [unclassified Blastococcus]